jgi:ethanolamine permease
VTFTHFSWHAFSANALPNGWAGAFASLPYAIWFYLAIEGLANVAEETKKPERDLPRGYVFAILTLVALAFLVLFSAVGVAGWEAVVFKAGTTEQSDSPLPLALGRIVGGNHILYHLLISIGLCGLLASFHGIILVAGRATMELGRTRYAPAFLGQVLKKNKTPASALLVNMIIGIGALFTEKTGDIITLSVFGALTLYVLSMASLFALRKDRPRLSRPFKVPGYPWVPGIALGLSLLCLASMAYYNAKIGLIYVVLLSLGFTWYYFGIPKAVRKREFSVMT